ncbi:MAG: SusC/RagA family TonB-linked outer membrane protein [Tannerellaceae bacterium]|jgi:TonB-linked SusC/RagA family outer membrane protein|nr:SusC/RagA family TonB-linked outer membrane protein [Tannerellaceae bacterium]
MKRFFIAFLLCLALLPGTNAQKTTVSIHVQDRFVYEILELLERQTSFSFIYDANVVDVSYRCSLQAQEENIFNVLTDLFKNTGIVYTVMDRQIILNKKETDAFPDQQTREVTGIVRNEQGEPVIGANILLKGTTFGAMTNTYGEFHLKIPKDSSIQVSYIGYLPQSIIYKGQPALNIRLIENVQSLDEVVVTALGIKKKEASLTYAPQSFTGSELTRERSDNIMSSLSGKVAGVFINRNSSGLGASARVVIRGSRSINGSNQPLYVIDGMPVLNSTNEQAYTAIGGTANAANRDGGDGISNLNQDDIESIHILKGASASALYGSQAANGVILITTKKGRAGAKQIEFSSNLSIDKVTGLPAFQNNYGRSESSTGSWGDFSETPVYDNLDDFFRTGIHANNSLSITSGNETLQTYFSYANTITQGLIEHSNIKKHNINFRETAGLFNNRLVVDGNVNLMLQQVNNKPSSGGLYMNPLAGLYTFPVGMDLSPYKKEYEIFNEERNMPVQNWFTEITDYSQNPYWLLNRAQSKDKRSRAIATFTASVKATDWLALQGRGNIDYIDDAFQQRIYAGTSPGLAGTNGRFIDYSYQETLLYGDIMATFNKNLDAFSLQAVIGSSVSDNRVSSLRLDSKTASLYYPNVFTIANINMSTSAFIDERDDERRQLQSVFFTAQAGYKERVYLDLSMRNDWASTLAFTKSRRKGYLYPSVGLSWIVSRAISLPEWVDYAKIRGSWNKVGNDIPLYMSATVSHIGAGGALLPSSIAPFGDLKPEMSASVETGAEWRLFENRLYVDFTYYRTNTRNQLFTLPSLAGATHKYYAVNAGNIQNQGLELTVEGTPFISPGFMWRTAINYARNKNVVKALHKDLPAFIYGDEGFSSSYSMRLVEGGSFGDIYGKAFDRDESGAVRYGESGLPLVVGEGNTIKVGNSNPDFMLGWNNTFTYRGFTFHFLADGRFGGDVLSQTQAVLDQYGVSRKTGEARSAGYVELEGHKIYNVRGFYEQVGGRSGVTEYYMYDATNIRLRELSLGYSFPRKWLDKLKLFRQLQLSLTARNLFFIYKAAPFDPDAVLSTANNNQGIDIFGMPSTRNAGFSLKVTF